MTCSYAKSVNVICAECEEVFGVDLWLIVDITEHPDLIELIYNGNLHCFSCTNGHLSKLDTPLLVYLPGRNSPLLFSPKWGATTEQTRAHITTLVNRLRECLGSAWDDAWIAQGVSSMSRDRLPLTLAMMLSISPELLALHRHAIQSKERYEYTGESSALEATIASWQNILQYDDFPKTPTHYQLTVIEEAGMLFVHRYRADRRDEDLSQALELLRKTVQHSPSGSPNRPRYLNSFSIVLREFYHRYGYSENLQEAIDALHEAVQCTLPGSSDWLRYYGNLGVVLLELYKYNRNLQGLQKSIAAFQTVLQHIPQGSIDCLPHLVNLASALGHRYTDHGGTLHDLHTVIDALEEARALAPSNSPDLPALLNNLANSLMLRYERISHQSDLQEAIEAFKEALGNNPRETFLRIALLTNLGNAFREQYRRNGLMEDLQDAIHVFRQAVELIPPGAPSRALPLQNFAVGQLELYKHSGQRNDWQEAFDALEKAVQLTPPHAPELATRIGNQGMALKELFAITGQLSDLQKAIGFLRKAVQLTSENSPTLPSLLNNLGFGLRDLYHATDKLCHLEESIVVFEKVVELAPADAPEYSVFLNSLAAALSTRYIKTGNLQDWQRAIEVYTLACSRGLEANYESTLVSARSWGHLASLREKWDEAVHGYRYGMEAAELLYQSQLTIEGKETWLAKVRDLYARAAYALARCGHAVEAAITLERGRARLLGESLARDRTDFEKVREDAPEVYQAYQQAATRLRQFETKDHSQLELVVETGVTLTPEHRRAEAQQVRADLADAVKRIRSIPGYENFLTSPDWNDIAAAVEPQQPLVYLITTPIGGLAVIVHANGVEPVWADEFSEADLDALLVHYDGEEVTGGYLPGQLMSTQYLHDALDNGLPLLGDRLMGPVADRLRALQATGMVLIPGGRLGVLPLHAARYRRDREEVHLLDEFDVAYTPSAQGLAAARRAMHRQQRNVVSLVGVGNPLPHPQPLPYARAEIEEVANYFSQRAHPLYEENASRAGLLDKLGETSHVHLACHGVFDPEAPLHSHLQLSHHERLDLRDLLYGEAGRHLHHVRLVVLSACQTALTDFRRLPDEAIGLPTGFLQAGAPGVVGTLWSVDDLSTALLMAKFYALHLRGDPTAGAGPMPPVRALQQAQRWLREVTVGELFEHFERRRALHGTQGPAGVQRVSLALASAVVIRFALEEDPNTRPFDSPYHWAPFICIGV